MKATRQEVFAALESERNYQGTLGWVPHTPTEFLVYMQDYLTQAMHTATRTPEAQTNPLLLDAIRKIAGMGVACMEQHGAPQRGGFFVAPHEIT